MMTSSLEHNFDANNRQYKENYALNFFKDVSAYL